MLTDLQRTAYLDQVKATVIQHGWMVQGVAGGGDHLVEPSFAFTSGLTNEKIPELLLVGLPLHLMAVFLNVAARRHVESTFRVGDRITNIGLSVPLKVAAPYGTTPTRLGVAHDIFPATTDVTILQLLWPDKEGHWPDDRRFGPLPASIQIPPMP